MDPMAYIAHIRTLRLFKFLYWLTKLMLGLGFIISGMRKLPGVKFTTLPIDHPVGLFFEGMYQTGFYWNFIGYYQIAVGIVLMTPWFKKLTPLLLLPVTVNIFLVSLSLSMRGTPLITGAMLLGNVYLIVWHSKSYLPILKRT